MTCCVGVNPPYTPSSSYSAPGSLQHKGGPSSSSGAFIPYVSQKHWFNCCFCLGLFRQTQMTSSARQVNKWVKWAEGRAYLEQERNLKNSHCSGPDVSIWKYGPCGLDTVKFTEKPEIWISLHEISRFFKCLIKYSWLLKFFYCEKLQIYRVMV